MCDSTWTFREIDSEFGFSKGTAFRVFKHDNDLQSPRDFELLDNWQDAPRIQALKDAGRIYATTINAVLLTHSGYDRIRRQLIA